MCEVEKTVLNLKELLLVRQQTLPEISSTPDQEIDTLNMAELQALRSPRRNCLIHFIQSDCRPDQELRFQASLNEQASRPNR